jgi:hypothetical protein
MAPFPIPVARKTTRIACGFSAIPGLEVNRARMALIPWILAPEVNASTSCRF